jgi:hypothetical protein
VLLLDDEKHSEQLVVRVLCKVVGCRVKAQHCLPTLCAMFSWRAGGTGSPWAVLSSTAPCCVQVPDVDELKAKNLFETSKQLGQAIVTTALKEHAGPCTFTLASTRANRCLDHAACTCMQSQITPLLSLHCRVL